MSIENPTLDSWARQELARLVASGVVWPRDRYHNAAHTTRTSAVLMLFGETGREVDGGEQEGQAPGTSAQAGPGLLDLLVVRRSTRLRHHPGQVALPGGGTEPADADAHATALREAQEETGVIPSSVEVIGELDPLAVVASANLVTPVVGWWHSPGPVHAADAEEIDLVRRVPVRDLLDPARRVRAELRDSAGEVHHWTPGIQLDEALMWGFTAIVVVRALDVLGWGAPTDWESVPGVDPRH